MSSVEERLARIERELNSLRNERLQKARRKSWVFDPNDHFRGDADLKEIFRLAQEIRDQERTEEAR
jgi:hypothetical protein